jgi:hypothetical protein
VGSTFGALSYRHAQAIGFKPVPLFRHVPKRRHDSLRQFMGVVVESGGAQLHKLLTPCRLLLLQKNGAALALLSLKGKLAMQFFPAKEKR